MTNLKSIARKTPIAQTTPLDRFFSDAFGNFGRNLWAYDPTLDLLSGFDNFTSSVNFPKYDIIKEGENIRLDIALAGYKKDDIQVELTPDDKLRVSHENLEEIVDENVDMKYLHKGIASRSFDISWKLSPHHKVGDVTFENGILSINIKNRVPDKPKSKLLEIK